MSDGPGEDALLFGFVGVFDLLGRRLPCSGARLIEDQTHPA